jgi:hypothetical protein
MKSSHRRAPQDTESSCSVISAPSMAYTILSYNMSGAPRCGAGGRERRYGTGSHVRQDKLWCARVLAGRRGEALLCSQ